MKIRKFVLCALFSALMCIGAPMSVPIGTMPVTLGLFCVALTAFCLDAKESFVAVAVYLLIGLAGFPVFSGFRGGLGAVFSPTGGFLLSYVLICPMFSHVKYAKTKITKALFSATALAITYACGTLWYMFFMQAELMSALTVCVLPFVMFDIAKIYIAFKTAELIRKRIKM